ncbi:MAG TPA: hypothetical protein VLG47_02920 [Candidatus Saccharimonadales bacterium]|nr:hypothetical protein [Candidatus Saccharimonadales bacterium]
MSEIISSDGRLARRLDGDGLALVFNTDEIGDVTAETLSAVAPQEKDQGQLGWKIVGRSALGFNGIDVRQEAAGTRVNGNTYVPIDLQAYTANGDGLISHLSTLTSEHHPGKSLVHEGYDLAFGRLLKLTSLVQLTGDEISDAFKQHLIAVDYTGNQRGVQIVDDTLSLPLEPVELVPNGTISDNTSVLLSMLRYGHSARAFMYEHTTPRHRNGRHTMPEFVLGAVVFSPGPFYGEVVEVVSKAGVLPQLPSAAWFDADRSSGLHHQQQPGHRGRQIEVINPEPDTRHPWAGARVAIRLYKPSEDSGQPQMDRWLNMNRTQRSYNHFSGYGGV